MDIQQKTKWLIEWEVSDSKRSFANWMIEKAEALEAELEAVKLIMDQPWDDNHDRGREEAFRRLARINNALNMNSDPLTEDTPQETLAGES